MIKRTLHLLLFACVSGTGAMGQINCATGSADATKLVCQIPFSTGVFSTIGSSSSSAEVQKNATAINSSIATQVSQLPVASSSSGVVVIYRAGVPETYSNLGPILTDRSQTIGRHKLFLGFSASQFVFTDVDGIPLKNVPFTYEATSYAQDGKTVLSQSYISGSSNISFKINQYIAIGTFGLTDKIDFSMILPIERVSIGAETYNTQGYLLNADNVLVIGPYSIPPTYVPGTASGIGDITFIGKDELWRGEHTTFAAGMNLRTPTGDALNYLGSGAWGFNPFLVVSYLWKVSPHAKIGYQWNTSTILNNNTALPGGLQYDAGADWAMLKSVTVAGDLLGSQYLNAPRLVAGTTPLPVPLTNPPTPTTVNLPTVTTSNSGYTINDFSAGLKWRPFRGLVLSGNVLFQLNNNGMRSRPTPLVGISYKF